MLARANVPSAGAVEINNIPVVVGLSAPSEGELLTLSSSPGLCETHVVDPPPSQFTAYVQPKSSITSANSYIDIPSE